MPGSRSAGSARGASGGRTVATSRAGISRSGSTPSRRSQRTASRSSSDVRARPAAARRRSCPRSDPDALPAWGWTLPEGAGTYHALFPRAWQVFEPEVLGVRLVGEQLSPVIAGDLESSALPGRRLRMVGREPGTRPADRRDHAQLAGPALPTTGRPRPGRGMARDRRNPRCRRGDPPRPRRCSVGIARDVRHCGVPRARRDRHDPRSVRRASPTRSCGPTSPPTAGSIPTTDPRPSAAGEAIGVAVAATVELAPGRASLRPFRAGLGPPRRRVRGRAALVEALHPRLGPDRRARLRPGQPRPRAGAGVARGDRGLAAAGPRVGRPPRLVQGGAVQRAVLPRRRRHVLGGRRGRTGRNPIATIPAGSRSSSASTTRSTTASTSTSTRRSRSSGSSPSSRRAGSATCWRRSPSMTRRSSRSRRPGCRPRARSAGPFRTTSAAPTTTRSTARTAITTRTSTTGRTSAPSSSSRSGATRSRPAADGDALIRDAWPTVEALLTRLSARDRDGDGLPEHDGLPDQTYDTWPMHGPSAYGGSLWLGALAAAEAMAGRLGDGRVRPPLDGWFERGQVAFDRRLWRGDHYAYDDGGGAELGQHHGRPAGGPVVRGRDRARRPPAPRTGSRTTLRTIHRMNVCGFAGGTMGAVNGIRPDGSVDHSSEQSAEVWVGTTYALAAFMIGRGLTEEGWSTASGRRRGHVRARSLVPDTRGVRRGRQLPGEPLPAAAGHLGDRGSAGATRRGSLRPARTPGLRPEPAPRTGRSVGAPPPAARTRSRSTSGRARRPTARRHSPGRPPRAPR